jgi:glycyl-tRNA synthetase beta chain
MVGEFPELQGIMGGYYAEKNPQGWDGSIVGPAIKTHYQPKGPSDEVPTGIVAVSVALADKLDTLIEFFSINEKPTGSGDPYALRRAALGVIRINLENKLSKFELARFTFAVPELFAFVLERLRVKLKGEGQRFDILDAAMAFVAEGNLMFLMERVDAISELIAADDGRNLLAAYRRAANILRIENDKDGPHSSNVITANLVLPEEKDFWAVLKTVKQQVQNSVSHGDYRQAMKALATLRAPVDAFFEKITVNAPEPELRRNRLALLAQLRDTMHQIADFSKIEG